MDKSFEDKNSIWMRIGIIAIIIVCAVLLVFGIAGVNNMSRQQNQLAEANSSIHKNAKVEDIDFDAKKVNMYFFWGSGCPHCEELWEYLESIEAEYGDKFTVYGFEVWNNEDNSALKDKIAEKLGDEDQIGKDTVPYLVIDDESYLGFNSSREEVILNKIIESYRNIGNIDQHKELVE